MTGGIESSGQKIDKKRKEVTADTQSDKNEDQEEGVASASGPKKVYSHNKVRTSLHDRTLDSMFPVTNPSQIGKSPSANPNSRYREVKESECFLTSVISLRKRIAKGKHTCECFLPFGCSVIEVYTVLTEIMEKHIFVGIVDMDRCLSLLQYSTKLYLVNHGALA